MYRCCQCATPIGWFPAAMSTVMTPLRCASCALEQHRRLPLWPFLLFYVASMASAVFGAIVSVEAPRLVWAGVLPMLAVGVTWERWLYGRGEMVPTVRWKKRVAQVVFYGGMGTMVAAGMLAVYLSPP